MSDWKVKDKTSDLYDRGESIAKTIITAPLSMLAGNSPSAAERYSTYTVENNEGETREVRATDDDDLGDRISKGLFED